ncbi:MAG TPA: hypothetical protein VII08_21215 [Myxococcales bacterium]
MRHTTLAILLLVISACTLGRASGRRAAEFDPGSAESGLGRDRPYVWRGTGEDGAIDAANAAIAAGWVAGTAALTPDEPSGALCEGAQPGDPPHTCPAKAGDDR